MRHDYDATAVIRTAGLSKAYHGQNALTSLNLTVPRHSIFGFLGPNGAGKSTTIKLLLGLARPTSGTATIFGYDSVGESVAIRQRVGYLAQDPHYYDHMTARQTLRFTARFFYSGPRDAIEDRVAAMLDLVGLADKADRPIKGFSGGERQRLGIAQAQVNAPDLLILDEPAASLDPLGRRDVLAVMERLRTHTTIFYSTHILEDVQRVSDTVAILNAGRLVAQAPIGELLAGSAATPYVLTVKGDGPALHAAQASVLGQPWVVSLEAVATPPDAVTWTVSVRDEAAAEAGLLGLALAGGHTTVTAFGRAQHNLEDVFMGLVEGGTTHGR